MGRLRAHATEIQNASLYRGVQWPRLYVLALWNKPEAWRFSGADSQTCVGGRRWGGQVFVILDEYILSGEIMETSKEVRHAATRDRPCTQARACPHRTRTRLHARACSWLRAGAYRCVLPLPSDRCALPTARCALYAPVCPFHAHVFFLVTSLHAGALTPRDALSYSSV